MVTELYREGPAAKEEERTSSEEQSEMGSPGQTPKGRFVPRRGLGACA